MCNTNRCSFGLQPLLNELIHEIREIWIGASYIGGDRTSLLDHHLLFVDWWQTKKILVIMRPHTHKEKSFINVYVYDRYTKGNKNKTNHANTEMTDNQRKAVGEIRSNLLIRHI